MISRVRIRITAGASPSDQKTTLHLVRTIQAEDSPEIYAFPQDQQPLQKFHKVLSNNSIIKSAVAAITLRGQTRNPVITLNDELKKLYTDEEGNFSFEGKLLEELPASTKDEPKNQTSTVSTAANEKPLHSVTKDVVLDKFKGRNANATSWINLLEAECSRLGISENRYSEVLRLFIDGAASEWFNATRPNIPMVSWSSWKAAFIETFGNKGWSDVTYAYTYQYKGGPMLEYATKKLNLLVDADPDLPEICKVNHILVGLPHFVQNKLDRDEVRSVNKLISKISQLDIPKSSPSKPSSSSKQGTGTSKPSPSEYKPCSWCEKIGHPGRYHPESQCRTKQRLTSSNSNSSSNAYEKKNIRVVNNTELEDLVNREVDQKN